MMAIERVRAAGCGEFSKCEEIKDGKIVTCPKYIAMSGVDPTTGEDLPEVWDCSDNWRLKLLLEQSKQTRSVAAAVESMRNETVKRQDEFLNLAHQARLTNG